MKQKLIEGIDYEVIDNFLPEEEFSILYDKISSPNFPWYYQANTIDLSDDPSKEKFFYFTHNIVNESKVNSPYFEYLQEIIKILETKHIMRIIINLTPSVPTVLQEIEHEDYIFPHKGALLYLNTNNGPTVLEDGTKIDSIRNRLLKFDTSRPHSASRCSDQKVRLNIIFNYL
jgi:hypothetical protein